MNMLCSRCGEGFDPQEKIVNSNGDLWHSACFVWKPSFIVIPISIILVFVVLISVLFVLDQKLDCDKNEKLLPNQNKWLHCKNSCKARIVESIPDGLEFNGSTVTHLSTYKAWLQLIELAQHEIHIGSLYWSLQGKEFDHPTAAQGKDVFKHLKSAAQEKNIAIKIAQDLDTSEFPNSDTHDLEAVGVQVRRLNFTHLLGSGVLHTKMWIVDEMHAYVGSANLDWRSLTQVKELGILITHCSCFINDLKKIFEVYWKLGEDNANLPDTWPQEWETDFNKWNPMQIVLSDTPYSSYISSSPSSFCPKGRNVDLDAILDVIDNAKNYINIAVMDYFPGTLYTSHPKYWPEIDSRLRSAAIDRNVKIRLLMSKWKNTRKSLYYFLNSLQDLNGVFPYVDIEVKLFKVPATPDQARIPYARVNHNKYMVTEKTAYIGTSNWSADYFISTAGVGIIVTPQGNVTGKGTGTKRRDDLRTMVFQIFERDWNSEYASPLKRI